MRVYGCSHPEQSHEEAYIQGQFHLRVLKDRRSTEEVLAD